ncbi:MAG: FkbM family methyltransferase [Candidatus Desulfaltia sp.]|nr:FkbM family methyltransferase [Candidatus Desulfaltia sp.]
MAIKFGVCNADPVLFRTRREILVEVPQRLLQTFKEIFMDECYMDGLELHVPDNSNIIDIGANAGFFTLFAASRFNCSKILAYEPIPSNFKQLARNRGLNADCSMECFQKAVAGHSGTVEIMFNPDDSFTTSATIFQKTHRHNKIIQVPSITLSDIFREHSIERCDLLKMDCEGAEYDIIYGCPLECLSRIDQIAMEVHGGIEPKQNIESLETYLNEQGFTTRRWPVGMLWAWKK